VKERWCRRLGRGQKLAGEARLTKKRVQLPAETEGKKDVEEV